MVSVLRQAAVPATAGADESSILQGLLAGFIIHELTPFFPFGTRID